MGVLNYLKGVFGQNGQAQRRAWLTNSQPIFTSFGKDIYLSDFVNNAIDRVASEISKIEIKSIVQNGDMLKVQNDDITRLFRFKPNPLQTTSDFLSNVEWLRRKNRNVFIYPQYTTIATPDGRSFRKYTAFYPLNPQVVYIGVGDNGGPWEVKMDFEDGSSFTLPYEELIHLKWRRGKNTVVGGGDDYGMANDYEIIRTIDALDKTIQGLPKGIEASLQIKGVFHAKSAMGKEQLKIARDDFEEHIFTSKAGMIATDLAGEFTPVDIKAPDIPEAALKFLKSVIEERYGISAAVLSGDYTGEQHSAFYQTAIEDFIIQLEQATTACVFSIREQDVGHRIKCYYSKVAYMNTNDKMRLADLATKTKLMTLNQINEMYGLEPFPGGDIRMQSLNYADASIVNQYQLGKGALSQSSDEPVSTEANIEEVAQDVAGKALNGAQTQSLLAVMEQYTDGKLSIGQAVNIVSIAIGVSKKEAKEIIEGLE